MFAKIKVYLIGGVALAALIFVSSLLWQLHSISLALSASQSAEKLATAQRDQALDANKANTEALRTLAWYRAADAARVEQLSQELESLDKKYNDSVANREKLKKEHPDVKTFLELDIPPALRVQSKRKD